MAAKTARENTAPRKTPRKRAVTRQGQSAADLWKEEMTRAEGLAAKPYTLDGRYEEGQKLDHRSFGLGMVKRLISPDKMEVLFEDELKVMIRAVEPPPPLVEAPRRTPRRAPAWARRQMPSSARATAQDPEGQ